MVASTLITFAGALGSVYAHSLSVLIAWQAVSGVGLGGTMVSFDLLAEHSPPAQRGAVLNVAGHIVL